MGKDKKKLSKQPLVSLCMPTFNRRPFIPYAIKCFEHQTYPKDKMEWIIVDDGTDKIEDLVKDIPQVRYYKYDEKMTLGKKRNLVNSLAKGDIIVYMDDDDYYPPERVSHAVERLRENPKALCAGSSAMFIYFKHISKMYRFGPYGDNHATAATFAFKRELLNKTKFNETASVAEEKQFLKDYTIPFVQLDPMKTIVVFSHNQNSFDKKELLKTLPNPTINETPVLPGDIVKEQDILKFFMEDIDDILSSYDAGNSSHKTDVVKQLAEIKKTREDMVKKQNEYNDTLNKLQLFSNPQAIQMKINEQAQIINNLLNENNSLKEKNIFLELIMEQIQKRKSENP